ncbi:MAG: NmrA family NAD(P)-binding protein [Myxococcaceae bacterium]|nr:NmrA family NAD(P)-binding protein [Myxococcaceae bacterium]
MFAVAGVSGHTGKLVAEALLAQKKTVRVIVRDAAKGEPWKKRGAEVAVADLGDAAALTKALTGVTGAYLLSPPNFGAADYLADRAALLKSMVDAIRASKLPSVVFLSSIGAQHPAGTGPIVALHRAEQALRGVAPSVTFIRASYFLENWGGVVAVAKAQGVLPFFGDTAAKFHQQATPDIATAAVQALLSPADGTKVVELAGKEDLSADDVAQALGTLLGKPVKAVGAPVSEAKAGLLAAGMPPVIAGLYAEMYDGMSKGLVAFENEKAVVRGSTPLVDALRPLV